MTYDHFPHFAFYGYNYIGTIMFSNSLISGRWGDKFLKKCNLRIHVADQAHAHFLWNSSQVNVKIGPGNARVPSGNTPIPGPIVTKFYDATWLHQDSLLWKIRLFDMPVVKFQNPEISAKLVLFCPSLNLLIAPIHSVIQSSTTLRLCIIT